MIQLAAALILLAAEPAPPASPEVKAAAPAATPAAPAATSTPAVPAATEAAPAATPAPVPPGAPPAAPAAAPQAPPVAAASPVEPLETADPDAPRLVTASFGLQRLWPGGDAFRNGPMNDFTSELGGLELAAHFRLTQKWLVGLFLSAGAGGSPGELTRAACALDGQKCVTFTNQVGIEGRFVFTPTEPQSWWAGAGIGGETAGVARKGGKQDRPYTYSYQGSVLRLSAGWDRRVSRNWGWGFFGNLSFGTYGKESIAGGDFHDLPVPTAGHSWLGLGARIILFP